MKTLTIDENGQVTLPADLREQLGLKEGSQLRWSFDSGKKTLSLTPLGSVREAYGILSQPEKPLSIEKINRLMELEVAKECSE